MTSLSLDELQYQLPLFAEVFCRTWKSHFRFSGEGKLCAWFTDRYDASDEPKVI